MQNNQNQNQNQIINGHALEKLQGLEPDSIDLIVTDPPYGYSFMNKDWDKAVVSVDIWKQCLRILKPGAFAFIMSSPRQDVFCKMMLNLIDAGFRTDFSSIYWAYASGFPKAADVSKLVDKRNGRNFDTSLKDYMNQNRLKKGLNFNQINDYLGTALTGGGTASAYMGDKEFNEIPTMENYNKLKTLLDLDNRFDELIEREEAEREIIEQKQKARSEGANFTMPTMGAQTKYIDIDYTKPATEQAKKLEGAYAGFQPKPAVELILVVMKPLSQKSYVDQALANGKGITWLDDCRIPYENQKDKAGWYSSENQGIDYRQWGITYGYRKNREGLPDYKDQNDKGRFPANLLVSDDVLNDGEITYGKRSLRRNNSTLGVITKDTTTTFGKGDVMGGYNDSGSFSRYFSLDKWAERTYPFLVVPKASKNEKGGDNRHPTVKPLKLMSYLIAMGSREGDTVLDPFCGSGTVLIAAHELHRHWIGIEINQEYCDIISKRLLPHTAQTRMHHFTNA